MKKRIIILTLSVSLAGLLLFAFITAVIMHNTLIEDSRSYLTVYMLSYEKNADKFPLNDEGAKLLSEETGGARVTFITFGGEVIADSQAKETENHSDRKEVTAAMTAAGEGFASRKSETVGVDLVYFCKRFDSRQILVRIALPVDGVLGVLYSLLPLLAAAAAVDAALSVALSFVLTRFVTRPVEKFAFQAKSGEGRLSAPYSELSKVAAVINELNDDAAEKVKRMESERQREQLVLESMDSGLIILDGDLKPSLINSAAASLFDYSGEGYVLALLSDGELRGALQEARALSVKRSYKGGDYLLRLSPSPQGTVVLITDVTAAESAARSKDEFIANVTHEMNTPLTSLSGFGELLAGGKMTKTQAARAGDIIVRESSRLKGMVKSIISYSALEDERAELEPVDLSKAAAECAALLLPAADKAGVTLTVEAEDGVYVKSTPLRIKRLTENLVSNAVRYNREGGAVKVSVLKSKEGVTLKIADTGEGIAKENLEKIFDRFYTVDASHSGKKGGYGLGLAIVKKIVRLSGWKITVTSKEGEGSVFTVFMPDAG